MYDIQYSKEAVRALKKMPKNTAKLVLRKLQDVAANPHQKNNNLKPLKGIDAYRLRVGDWRIIFEIKDQQLSIMVIKIRPRGDAYGV